MATEYELDFSKLTDRELVGMLRAERTGGSLVEEALARLLEYLIPPDLEEYDEVIKKVLISEANDMFTKRVIKDTKLAIIEDELNKHFNKKS